MKKRFILLTILCLSIGQISLAQKAKESVEPFQKGRQPSFNIQVDYPKKLVEEALSQRLKKDKLKGKSSKGITAYMQVDYPNISNNTCDFYTQVTGNKKSATIYIFVSMGYENFISSGDDKETAGKVKNFLESMIVTVKEQAYEQEVSEQEAIIKKADKNHKKLLKELDKLTEKRNNLEKQTKKSADDLKMQKDILNKLKKKGK